MRNPLFLAILFLAGGAMLAPVHTTPAAPRSDDTGAPIAVRPDAPTWKSFGRLQTAWCRRVLLGAFREHGGGRGAGQAPDEAMNAFVTQAVDVWAERDDDGGDTLVARAREILASDTEEPVTLYLAANLAYRRTEDWRTALAPYEKAFKRLEELPAYPRAITRFVGLGLTNVYKAGGKRDRIAGLDAKIAGLTRAALEDGSYRPEDDFLFVQHVLGDWGGGWFKRNPEALAEALPDGGPLPAWARETLLGHVEIERAWKDRGGGWASTVKPEGWKGFAEHLGQARGHLLRGWEGRPDRPEAATAMIALVMAGAGGKADTLRGWFDRATDAQFDYLTAHQHMLWALRPRWGGSHAEMLAFGRACLATRRFDTGVPSILFSALDQVVSEKDDWRAVYQRPDLARDIMTASYGLVEEPARAEERPLRLSYLAVNAWMCDLPEEAALALATLAGEGGFRSDAAEKLRRFGASQATFESEVALLSGPAWEPYRQARALDQRREIAPALAAYHVALERTGADGTGAALLKRRLRALEWEREFQGGDWVKIAPGADLSDWNVVSGQWTAVDGALQNQGADESALIVLPARLGGDFEVRGRFDVTTKESCCRALGVVIGYNERDPNGGDWHTCEAWQNGSGQSSQATLLDKFYNGKAPRVEVPNLKDRTGFLVQGWRGKISFYLDGKPVFQDYAPEARGVVMNRPAEAAQIGFGAHRFCAKNVTRILDLEVRRLAAQPVPPPMDSP